MTVQGATTLRDRARRTLGDHSRGHETGERLYIAGDTPIHRMPAHVKLLAALLTILIIVATPPQSYGAFAGYGLIVAAAVCPGADPAANRVDAHGCRSALHRVRGPHAVRRPRGPGWRWGRCCCRSQGCWRRWALVAKATLGVVISILLGATTTTADMVAGLRRLHAPDLLVQIFASMIRYIHVVGAELPGWRGPGGPGVSAPRGRGRGRCSGAPWEHCSSGPMSAANGFTWPCSAAATPAPCRSCIPILRSGPGHG